MKTTLSNQTVLTGLTYEEERKIKDALTFDNPKHAEALKFNRSVWKIPSHIELFTETLDGVIIPRGISFDWLDMGTVKDNRHRHPVQFTTSIKLRDYQVRALDLALEQRGGVIVAPTGSGKTTPAIQLAACLGERCLILVKSVDLAKQWIKAIKSFAGLDCGSI